MRKITIKKYLFLIIFFVFINIFKFPYNFYYILISDYEKRAEYHYGMCDKNGYGFLKKINSNYKFNQNIKTINSHTLPSSDWFFYNPNNEISEDRIILLNAFDKDIKQYLKNYEIEDQLNNCYLLVKK